MEKAKKLSLNPRRQKNCSNRQKATEEGKSELKITRYMYITHADDVMLVTEISTLVHDMIPKRCRTIYHGLETLLMRLS